MPNSAFSLCHASFERFAQRIESRIESAACCCVAG
jgi:hypothetical protein